MPRPFQKEFAAQPWTPAESMSFYHHGQPPLTLGKIIFVNLQTRNKSFRSSPDLFACLNWGRLLLYFFQLCFGFRIPLRSSSFEKIFTLFFVFGNTVTG